MAFWGSYTPCFAGSFVSAGLGENNDVLVPVVPPPNMEGVVVVPPPNSEGVVAVPPANNELLVAVLTPKREGVAAVPLSVDVVGFVVFPKILPPLPKGLGDGLEANKLPGAIVEVEPLPNSPPPVVDAPVPGPPPNKPPPVPVLDGCDPPCCCGCCCCC